MRSRKLLAVLAALVIPLAIPAPARAIGPALLPVTVTNSTGRGDAIFLYVIGVQLSSGRLGYVNQGGTFTPWTGGADPALTRAGRRRSPARATAAAPRSSSRAASPAASTSRSATKLKFFLTPDGLVQPAPWAGGDANRDILFDWSEFTYNDAGLWLNSSQVDMFAVPHAVTVTGASGATKRTGDVVNNGRNAIIDGIRAQAGWANTVYTRSDGTVLRVLAPGKAAGAGLLSTTYLDSYITSAWNAYTGKTLTVVPFGDQPNTRYFGRTSGNVMNFTNSAGPAGGVVQPPVLGQRVGLRRRPAAPRTTWWSARSRGPCAPR